MQLMPHGNPESHAVIVFSERELDGRATAYSEREREFAFAKNYNCVGTWATMWHRLHNRLNPFTQIIIFFTT